MLNAVGRNRRRGGYERELGGGYSLATTGQSWCQLPERAAAEIDGSLEWRSFKQLSTLAR